MEGRTNEDISYIQIRSQEVFYPPINIGSLSSKIEVFEIINCNLKYIKQSDFVDMKNLKELDFTSNLIEEIPPTTFDDLTQLLALQLDYNQIAKLPEGIFRYLDNVKTISLSSNKLEAVSASLFSTNIKLEVIQLDSNNLIYIESNTFSHLSNLRGVSMHFNPCFGEMHDKKLPEEIEELDALLSERCSNTCDDFAFMLSDHKKDFMECVEEFEKVLESNIKIKNEQKVCLLL